MNRRLKTVLFRQLRKTREEVLAITAEMVAYARSLVEDVEFSAEDALRSDWEFLAQVCAAVDFVALPALCEGSIAPSSTTRAAVAMRGLCNPCRCD
jgi:hypothetical protein